MQMMAQFWYAFLKKHEAPMNLRQIDTLLPITPELLLHILQCCPHLGEMFCSCKNLLWYQNPTCSSSRQEGQAHLHSKTKANQLSYCHLSSIMQTNTNFVTCCGYSYYQWEWMQNLCQGLHKKVMLHIGVLTKCLAEDTAGWYYGTAKRDSLRCELKIKTWTTSIAKAKK